MLMIMIRGISNSCPSDGTASEQSSGHVGILHVSAEPAVAVPAGVLWNTNEVGHYCIGRTFCTEAGGRYS